MRPHALAAALAAALSLPVCFDVAALPAPSGEVSVPAYFQSDLTAATALDATLALVQGARRRVLVAGYVTLPPVLAQALCAARRRGVDVRVVLDRSGPALRYSGAGYLTGAGVDVALASRPAWLTAPFVVADDAVALGMPASRGLPAGRVAPTQAPGGLDVYRDMPQLARSYTRTFWQLYARAADRASAQGH
ncbi:hypothetical protein [Xylophilus sp.]|uniref:hypothetical protein n=1 Tax=Xylophilus sp. TaxID=2653893 RepID=UPI0013B72519|nr:hypothetical protein [Xylophilus sp.]KAF1041392.1 MAG: hypothetical protein GAK38_04585 [Xylophilus sp.]